MVIVLNNLSKKFNNNFVLKDINYQFDKGNIFGLVGRNGSGKSVLLKIICGMYRPTYGKVIINGDEITCNNICKHNIRALIEEPAFFSYLSGYQNLKMLLDLQGKKNLESINKIAELLNLTSELNKKYYKYSLGTKQKLGIAQVLIDDPDVIILDEPFNGIESKTVDKLIDYLNEIKKDKIIIISTHIDEDLKKLNAHILRIKDGELKE